MTKSPESGSPQYLPTDMQGDVDRLLGVLQSLGLRPRFRSTLTQADVIRYALCWLSRALGEDAEAVGDSIKAMSPWLNDALSKLPQKTDYVAPA